MKRLTSERCSGIKRGYWSPAKKDELIQRLGKYEDTGLEPEEIGYPLSVSCAASSPKGEPRDGGSRWINVEDRLPVGNHKYGRKKVLTITKYGAMQVRYYDYDGWAGANPQSITHWMPLPEAPKEETT